MKKIQKINRINMSISNIKHIFYYLQYNKVSDEELKKLMKKGKRQIEILSFFSKSLFKGVKDDN